MGSCLSSFGGLGLRRGGGDGFLRKYMNAMNAMHSSEANPIHIQFLFSIFINIKINYL
jgi:hypothetical protein